MDYTQEHIKPYGEDGKKSEQVEEMFDNIAPCLLYTSTFTVRYRLSRSQQWLTGNGDR